MTKHIYLPREAKRELERTFKVSPATLWYALNFVYNSPRCQMLRAAARQRGGVLFDPQGPRHTTTFDHAESTMTQWFSDRVFLIADLKSGTVTIFDGGEEVDAVPEVTMKGLPAIQQRAQQLANTYKS